MISHWMKMGQIMSLASQVILYKIKKLSYPLFCTKHSFFAHLNRTQKLCKHLLKFCADSWTKTVRLCSFFDCSRNENLRTRKLLVPSGLQLFTCFSNFILANGLTQSCKGFTWDYRHFCFEKRHFGCFFDLDS